MTVPPTSRRIRYDEPKTAASFYGTSRNFIALRHDLLTAAAFLCLKPTACLVLLDFIGYFEEANGYTITREGADKGIRYSYSMCRFNIGRTTFYATMEKLRMHRFIFPHPDAAPIAGRHHVWRPSSLWKDYTPSQPDLLLLLNFNARRQQSVTEAAQAQFDFVTGISIDNENNGTAPPTSTTETNNVHHILSRILSEHKLPPKPQPKA